MIKYLSLFSGIGAFEKALEKLGIPFDLLAYSEIDKYASKSYSAIHGVDESENLGDVCSIDEWDVIGDLDLLTFGFPCQDISLSGYQKGFFNEDGTRTRSGLFFEALRIIKLHKPKVAIAENVKNLVSKKFTEQFSTVLTSLEDAGYNNYWKVLNAKDFGIPQNRERVFIVSIRKDVDNGEFQFPAGFPLNISWDDVLEEVVDEKFFMKDDKIPPMTIKEGNPPCCPYNTEEDGTCRTIKAQYFKNSQANFIKKGDQGATGVIQIGNCKPTKKRENPNQGRIVDSAGLAPALTTMGGGNREPFIVDDTRLRKLTPKECFRLMGFTDEDFEKAQAVNSNTQLYKQAGNSIVVNVLEEIFKGLDKLHIF